MIVIEVQHLEQRRSLHHLYTTLAWVTHSPQDYTDATSQIRSRWQLLSLNDPDCIVRAYGISDSTASREFAIGEMQRSDS